MRTRLLILFLMAAFLVSLVRNLHREGGDFVGYLLAGERVLRGESIYAPVEPGVNIWADEEAGANTWPPVFAVVCVPLALLSRVSPIVTRAAWLVVSTGLIVASVRIVIGLVYRRRLVLADPEVAAAVGAISIASSAVLVPLLLSANFLLDNLNRLQINPLILFLCLAGCAQLTRDRAARGGALIGLAAALKAMPVVFLPYFLWKRWWRALAAASTTLVVVSLAPILVFGRARWWSYVLRWREIAAGGWPVRPGNQSVHAMLDRALGHHVFLYSEPVRHLITTGKPEILAATGALFAATVVLFAAASRRGSSEPSSAAATVELAFVLAAAIVFSPLAWSHYYVFLLLALAILWRDAFLDGGPPPPELVLPAADRRRLRWLAGAAFFFVVVPWPGVIGKTLGRTLETLSFVTLGGLATLAALLLLRSRARPRTAFDGERSRDAA